MNEVCACGRPIPDTAYMCPSCQHHLAERLRWAAEQWEHLRDAVGGNTAVGATVDLIHSIRPTSVVGAQGPSCEGETCEHESCTHVWAARVRNGGVVERQAHEDRGPVDWNRSEMAWVVDNTANACAAFVANRRGNLPAPQRRSRPTIPTGPRVKVARCGYSDLPVEQCACGRHGRAGAGSPLMHGRPVRANA